MYKYLVEFLGTLFFLFIILISGKISTPTFQPFVIGLALSISILFGGSISGGHFNPAVSVMMVAAKKLKLSELLPYIISQVLGGLTALQATKYIKF